MGKSVLDNLLQTLAALDLRDSTVSESQVILLWSRQRKLWERDLEKKAEVEEDIVLLRKKLDECSRARTQLKAELGSVYFEQSSREVGRHKFSETEERKFSLANLTSEESGEMIAVLRAKEHTYEKRIRAVKARIRDFDLGQFSHESLDQTRRRLNDSRERLAKLEEKVRSFHGLSHDVELAIRQIEERRERLRLAQEQFEKLVGCIDL